MFDEKHYSVNELSASWGFSSRTIRRWFQDEPGVLCHGETFKRGKRGYQTIRIPQSVADRVYLQRSTQAPVVTEKPKYKRKPRPKLARPCDKKRSKIRARQKLAYAVKTGKVIRSSCEICGCDKTDAHHDDYERPLSVRWLCKVHHFAWHQQNGYDRGE